MTPFTFATSKSIICESGAASRLAEICAEQNIKSPLLITDPGIEKLGLHLEALNNFDNVEIPIAVFSEVEADPPESIVLAALAVAKDINADAIIGFGGGSSMDVAKLIALLAHPDCQQQLSDIYGVGNATGSRLPLIQVPTTAGTGSEVTQVAIVTTGETTKMGAVSPLFLPDIAILDAELTTGLPPQVTAATGVDAMVHAIESYTSKIKKNPLSDMLAKEALRLMAANLRTAVHDGSNQQAREAMLLGAMLAGQAFANAPVAAVHALAYPLGGHFHIPHGLSNSLVLPHVMRFNAAEQPSATPSETQPSAITLYAELAPIILQDNNLVGSDEQITQQLIDGIESLIKDVGLPTTLKEMNINEDFLPKLAEDAMLQQRLLINNPRDVNYEDALAIYQSAY